MTYRYFAVVSASGEFVRALPGDTEGLLAAPDDDALARFRLPSGERVQERVLPEPEVEFREGKPFHREYGVALLATAEKMSKSRGNVTNPDTVIHDFGADSLRIYEMFMGPLEQTKPWQTSGIQGVRRFLDRVYTVASRELDPAPGGPETKKLMHRTLKKVGDDIEALRFNTAVSQMMIFTNHLVGLERPPRDAVELLVLCLAPFAPHLAEELWEQLGHRPTIADVSWPSYDPAQVVDEELEIAVQVNGKVRGRVLLSRTATEADARSAARADENVMKFLADKTEKKLVYVPGRVLNFIIG
jgi:leucyl-tRNA synthetase